MRLEQTSPVDFREGLVPASTSYSHATSYGWTNFMASEDKEGAKEFISHPALSANFGDDESST